MLVADLIIFNKRLAKDSFFLITVIFQGPHGRQVEVEYRGKDPFKL